MAKQFYLSVELLKKEAACRASIEAWEKANGRGPRLFNRGAWERYKKYRKADPYSGGGKTDTLKSDLSWLAYEIGWKESGGSYALYDKNRWTLWAWEFSFKRVSLARVENEFFRLFAEKCNEP